MACSICLEDYSQRDVGLGKVLEHRVGEGRHGFHKYPCLRAWAQKSSKCPMKCAQEIISALPWHQRIPRKVWDYFKMRPAATIVAVGAPLLALNAAGAGAAIKIASLVGTGIAAVAIETVWKGVGTSVIAGGLAVLTGVLAGAAAEASVGATIGVVGGSLVIEMAKIDCPQTFIGPLGMFIVRRTIGAGIGAMLTGAEMGAGGLALVLTTIAELAGLGAAVSAREGMRESVITPQFRDFLAIGAAVISITGASAIINGSGLPVAGMFLVLSAYAAYLSSRS